VLFVLLFLDLIGPLDEREANLPRLLLPRRRSLLRRRDFSFRRGAGQKSE